MLKTRDTLIKRNLNILIAVVIIILLLVVGYSSNKNFTTLGNIGTILTLTAILSFASAGQTLVIISGNDGIDLSIGATISLSAVMSALIMKGQNKYFLLALIVVLTIGVLIGLINSFGIIYGKVPPLVMTMAVSNIVIVVQMLVSQGAPTGNPSEMLQKITSFKFNSFFSGLFIVSIFLIFIIQFLLNKTNYGKQLFAIGNNAKAAMLTGVKVDKIRIITYIFSGCLSALAGFVLIGYNGFVYLNMGDFYLLPTIASVVIGGTSLKGGEGGFNKTYVGAILLTVLSSLLLVLHTDEAGRQIINGIVLLVILSVYTREKKLKQ